MNREKIKLITNVPLTLELEDANGAESTSHFHDGVEYRFMVRHRDSPSILYLPVDGMLAVKRSQARAGEEIELLKTMANGKPVFTAHRIGQQPLPAAPAAPQQPQPTRLLAPMPQYAQPQYAQSPQHASAQHASAQHASAQHGNAARAIAEPVPQVHPLEEVMTRCFVVAGRALWNARQTLLAEGIPTPEPAFEDFRAAAISMWIERSRGNGGRS